MLAVAKQNLQTEAFAREEVTTPGLTHSLVVEDLQRNLEASRPYAATILCIPLLDVTPPKRCTPLRTTKLFTIPESKGSHMIFRSAMYNLESTSSIPRVARRLP